MTALQQLRQTVHVRLCSAILVAAAAAPVALALPGDRDQPIEIQADTARLDERAGTAIYTGNVDLRQGTLNVTATRMTIWLVGDQVTRIRARGDTDAGQAHYEQQPEPDAANVRADADELVYEVDEQLIHLAGDAVLIQSGDRFEGERLRYDIEAGEVDASSDGPSDRIRMTLQPKRLAPTP